MSKQVPGAAWVSLVVLLTGALSGWLTDWIAEPWVPLAVVGLSTVAKLVQIGWEIYGPKASERAYRVQTATEPKLLTRVLFD